MKKYSSNNIFTWSKTREIEHHNTYSNSYDDVIHLSRLMISLSCADNITIDYYKLIGKTKKNKERGTQRE